MMHITRKDFINYAVLPGLRPRLSRIFASGFQYVPYFIALVYGAVKLLPAAHPYLNPSNIGRFGIRHVIAEAANNLEIKGENIDQIILFITILVGLVLVLAQIVLLGLAVFFQPVIAGGIPTNFAGFFITPPEDQAHDIAHMMLDMVFGVPDLFNSCIAQQISCLDQQGNEIQISAGAGTGTSIYADLGFPFPIHNALHQMFLVYSLGLLVVAVFITLYFMVAILAETAQTGTAFGKRFNKVWAPVRIVVAFGLLVPIGDQNLNASQYIVLYTAKFGSGFATNGWKLFNDTITGAYIGQVTKLISKPNPPEVGALLQFYYVARTCEEFEEVKNAQDIDPYLVKGTFNPTGNALQITENTTYEAAVQFAAGADQLVIRFGYQDEEDFPLYLGNVGPVCGEIVMPLADSRCPGGAGCGGIADGTNPERGPEIMQRYYWFILKELWFSAMTENPDPNIASLAGFAGNNFPRNTVAAKTTLEDRLPQPVSRTLPDESYKRALQDFYGEDLRAAMTDPGATGLAGILGSAEGALPEQALSARFNKDPVLVDKGWAGAGIWYNRIAELNGVVTTAVMNIPLPAKYPAVMEYVHFKKRQQDQNVPFKTRFKPQLANGDDIIPSRPEDSQAIVAYDTAFDFWQDDDHTTTTHSAPTGNAITDAINALFGTEGLFNIRENNDVHPLAQLVGVGRSLVEAAVRNLTYAVIGGAGGAGLAFFDQFSGDIAQTAASFLITIAMIALTAGFILFYVVPFLPFIYFFSAVGGWIKGIFEAMVGAPLWALAHIRIDGEGLSGQAALSGYFLLFEIFLRPILIIFGLLASISIFAALVNVLNQTWDLVVSNVSGFDVRDELTGESGLSKLSYWRSAIDEFFFTVIYTIIVYLMGMSSFKLIDAIPNNILRWMGQSVASFGDQRDDPAKNLISSASVGSQQALSSIGGGLQKFASMNKSTGAPR